jgi:hypothetical protein
MMASAITPAKSLMLLRRQTRALGSSIRSEHFIELFSYPRTSCTYCANATGCLSLGEPFFSQYLMVDCPRYSLCGSPSSQLHADVAQTNIRREEHCWCYDEETMQLLLDSIEFC